MITRQIWVFVFLCIIAGTFDYYSDRSKEKLKSFILLLIVLTLIILAALLDGTLSYLPIGIMIIINIGYIIRLGHKNKC